jgi:hypothetical protein
MKSCQEPEIPRAFHYPYKAQQVQLVNPEISKQARCFEVVPQTRIPQALEHLVSCSKGANINSIATVECDECGVAKTRRQILQEPRQLDK